MEYFIGDLISGRYEVYKKYYGGFGIVYILFDHKYSSPIAAKTFPFESYAIRRSVIEDFKQECEKWIDIDAHPNIVRASSIHNLDGGRPFLFLEYISGGSLFDLIKVGALKEDRRQLLNIALDICNGMNFANENGILVHRDLKPSNILISSDRIAKVTDFGISMVGNKNLNISGVIGTLPYMSPEQINGNDLDITTDIYAFGHILFEMITGERAFNGQNEDEYKIAHLEAKFPIEKVKDEKIAKIILKCVGKNKNDRYSNFAALGDELSNLYNNIFKSNYAKHYVVNNIEYEYQKQAVRSGALIELHKCDEAIEICKNVIEKSKDPITLSIAFNHLGWAMVYKDENYEECEEYFRKSIEFDSENEIAWINLGLLLRKQGKTDEAISCYERAIVIDKTHPISYLNLGTTYLKLGEIDKAEHFYKEGIKVNPKHTGLNSALLGFYTDYKDDRDQRFIYASNLFESLPWNPKVLLELFYYYALNGISSEEALKVHKQLLKLNIEELNTSAMFWTQSARLYNKLKIRADLAVEYSLKAIEIDGDDIFANMELASSIRNNFNSLANINEIPKEICKTLIYIYTKVINLDSNFKEAYRLISIYCRRIGDTKSSLDFLRVAVSLDPNDGQIYNELGNTYYEIRDFPSAIRNFQLAIDKDPSNAMFYYNLADTYIDLEDYDSAINYFNEAIAKNENYPEAYHSLGLCYMSKDNFELALINYDLALLYNPNHRFAWESKAKIFILNEDFHSALSCYKMASINYENANLLIRKQECDKMVVLLSGVEDK